MYLAPSGVYKISDCISLLNSNKATGYNNIPAFFLKVSSNILAYYLHDLIKFAFNNGTFPDNCKIAKFVPIYKSGDKNNPKNFRPISILTCLSKIFEKLFLKITKSLIPINMTFKENYLTTLAILDIVTTSYDNMNHYTGLLFLD